MYRLQGNVPKRNTPLWFIEIIYVFLNLSKYKIKIIVIFFQKLVFYMIIKGNSLNKIKKVKKIIILNKETLKFQFVYDLSGRFDNHN